MPGGGVESVLSTGSTSYIFKNDARDYAMGYATVAYPESEGWIVTLSMSPMSIDETQIMYDRADISIN